jgi:GalNAc5-diNAcBac-PP-undecaprenol beta-1,3-glucosyltransferase
MLRRREFMVILPTHNHPESLEFAALSVLGQSFEDFLLVVIGDGVDPESRSIALALQKEDGRVRFRDFPKAESRGEVYRDLVIRKFRPRFITYLCDDDLFLSTHLEVMRNELESADFVHPQPVYVSASGQIASWFRTDLSLKESRDFLLMRPWRNSISLTGASHTLDAYLKLPVGWHVGPPDRWTDHYMWEQFLRQEGLRFNTSRLSTTVKLPAKSFTPETRRETVRSFYERLDSPGFNEAWNEEVQRTLSEENVQCFLQRQRLASRVKELEGLLVDLEHELSTSGEPT